MFANIGHWSRDAGPEAGMPLPDIASIAREARARARRAEAPAG